MTLFSFAQGFRSCKGHKGFRGNETRSFTTLETLVTSETFETPAASAILSVCNFVNECAAGSGDRRL